MGHINWAPDSPHYLRRFLGKNAISTIQLLKSKKGTTNLGAIILLQSPVFSVDGHTSLRFANKQN